MLRDKSDDWPHLVRSDAQADWIKVAESSVEGKHCGLAKQAGLRAPSDPWCRRAATMSSNMAEQLLGSSKLPVFLGAALCEHATNFRHVHSLGACPHWCKSPHMYFLARCFGARINHFAAVATAVRYFFTVATF